MRLSICIPTHNRAAFLEPLFDSILSQTGYRCDVEIVVSDNASTDDTAVLVERYQARFPHFVYHRAATNRGADRNFLKAVELATGDFCWLMGSDDKVEPGGIAHVEKVIAVNPEAGGLSVRSRSYNFSMDALIPSALVNGVLPKTTVLHGAETIFATLGSYIGFLSGNVVDRSLWQDVVAHHELEPYFNGWIHAYVIGLMIQQRPEWVYVASPCVGWRSGNDSFLSEGMYRRLEIDVAGYDQVVTALFGAGSRIHRDAMRAGLPHARHRILHAKVNGAPISFFRQSHTLLVKHYHRSARFWISCYPVFLIPAPIAKFAKFMRDHLTGGTHPTKDL